MRLITLSTAYLRNNPHIYIYMCWERICAKYRFMMMYPLCTTYCNNIHYIIDLFFIHLKISSPENTRPNSLSKSALGLFCLKAIWIFSMRKRMAWGLSMDFEKQKGWCSELFCHWFSKVLWLLRYLARFRWSLSRNENLTNEQMLRLLDDKCLFRSCVLAGQPTWYYPN